VRETSGNLTFRMSVHCPGHNAGPCRVSSTRRPAKVHRGGGNHVWMFRRGSIGAHTIFQTRGNSRTAVAETSDRKRLMPVGATEHHLRAGPRPGTSTSAGGNGKTRFIRRRSVVRRREFPDEGKRRGLKRRDDQRKKKRLESRAGRAASAVATVIDGIWAGPIVLLRSNPGHGADFALGSARGLCRSGGREVPAIAQPERPAWNAGELDLGERRSVGTFTSRRHRHKRENRKNTGEIFLPTVDSGSRGGTGVRRRMVSHSPPCSAFMRRQASSRGEGVCQLKACITFPGSMW